MPYSPSFLRILQATPGHWSELRSLRDPEFFPSCPQCAARWRPPSDGAVTSETELRVKRIGHYVRHSDSKVIPRFYCKPCKRTFSAATKSPFRGAKKRHLDTQIFQLLCSAVSMRRTAKLVGVKPDTVARSMKRLGREALKEHRAWIEQTFGNTPIEEFDFDEMETHEHTKMKPLSVPMAVDSKTRKILGFSVAQMAPRAVHWDAAQKKYGPRSDRRADGLQQMLRWFSGYLAPEVIAHSDAATRYPIALEKAAPEVKFEHRQSISRRACVAGQGELKKGGYDPLFEINHSCAMVRANVSRMIRRTWNTTKRRTRLWLHLALYIRFHNLVLT